jgi:hypothetical protein
MESSFWAFVVTVSRTSSDKRGLRNARTTKSVHPKVHAFCSMVSGYAALA